MSSSTDCGQAVVCRACFPGRIQYKLTAIVQECLVLELCPWGNLALLLFFDSLVTEALLFIFLPQYVILIKNTENSLVNSRASEGAQSGILGGRGGGADVGDTDVTRGSLGGSGVYSIVTKELQILCR